MSGSDDVAVPWPEDRVPPPRYTADFASDWASAIRDAGQADDDDGRKRLVELWFDYFDGKLPSLGSRNLVEYLESHHVWRAHGGWPVYKTAETPCLAFTASLSESEMKVTLVALGYCYKYPANGEEGWWLDVILPRVGSL